MAKKKNENNKQVNIKAGNFSGVSGAINIAGGDISTQQTTTGLSALEIGKLFKQIYNTIEMRPDTSPAVKADLKAEVQEVQTSVTQTAMEKKEIDESFLSRHFRNIARMAPDILDVVVATLGSPLAGIGVAVKKIAEKAKEEATGD
jgi:hypothetical protein